MLSEVIKFDCLSNWKLQNLYYQSFTISITGYKQYLLSDSGFWLTASYFISKFMLLLWIEKNNKKVLLLFLFVFRIETVGKIFNKISSLNCLLKTFQSSPHDKLRDCPEPTGRWKFKNLNHYKYNQLASLLPPRSYGNLLVLKHFQVILGFAA